MGQSIKMLMVDDRMMTSELDRAGYRQMGLQVRQVHTSADAIKKAQGVDVICINYDFEAVDCLNLVKHFKATFPDVLVVVTSVQSSAKTETKVVNSGADVFVQLPLPRHYFVERIKKMLDKVVRDNHRVSLQVSGILHGVKGHVEILDVSSGGLLIRSDEALPLAAHYDIEFSIPSGEKIAASGEVVRVLEGDDVRYGLKFTNYKGLSESILRRFLKASDESDKKMIYYL